MLQIVISLAALISVSNSQKHKKWRSLLSSHMKIPPALTVTNTDNDQYEYVNPDYGILSPDPPLTLSFIPRTISFPRTISAQSAASRQTSQSPQSPQSPKLRVQAALSSKGSFGTVHTSRSSQGYTFKKKYFQNPMNKKLECLKEEFNLGLLSDQTLPIAHLIPTETNCHDENPYIGIELIDGSDLSCYLNEYHLYFDHDTSVSTWISLERFVIFIFDEIFDKLLKHTSVIGIVHLDLHLGNIMQLNNEHGDVPQFRVIDWGIGIPLRHIIMSAELFDMDTLKFQKSIMSPSFLYLQQHLLHNTDFQDLNHLIEQLVIDIDSYSLIISLVKLLSFHCETEYKEYDICECINSIHVPHQKELDIMDYHQQRLSAFHSDKCAQFHESSNILQRFKEFVILKQQIYSKQ